VAIYKDYEEMFQDESILDPSDRAGGTYEPGLKYWRLVQTTSSDDKIKHLGEWSAKDQEGTLQFRVKMEVIILDSRGRYTRWEAGHVACRSYDAVHGPDGQDCRQSCEYFTFRKSAIAVEDKCRGSVVLLCVSASEPLDESFVLELPASGIADWREYASWLQDQKQRPVFACSTAISTIRRKQGAGNPYVPVFRPVAALPPDMLAEMRERRIADSHYLDAPHSTPTAQAEPRPATWDDEEAPTPNFEGE